MHSLARRGFVGISLSELLDAWDSSGNLPPRPVVLTFDDGFANVLEHAAPLLSELGFRATVFVVTGRCGQMNDWPNQAPGIPRLPLLSWSELAQMATAGFEIGAHSVTHPILPQIPQAEAEREIMESKATIEQKLGRPVSTFAYPFGIFTRAHYEIVRNHFQAGCSVELGKVLPESDRYQLPRLDIYYLRHPILFRLFETVPGQLYLRFRGIGRQMRGKK
jgi:peptidoglycan/xylan/chitin deacetylase (PgdA/CDA1 family)